MDMEAQCTPSRDVGRLRGLFEDHPVVGILGPRQVGKTTLACGWARFARQTVATA
jgi:predicted AAA+ superfamily ATPase